MVMISDQNLAHVRTETAHLLPDTCDILRVTQAQDEGGGQIITETLHATGVPCRYVEELSNSEQAYINRFRFAVDAKLTLLTVADIRDTDRITNLRVDGVLMTTLVNGAAVLQTYAVHIVPLRSLRVIQPIYIGRL